jgi:phosphorylase/glycogen(starch) synthase
MIGYQDRYLFEVSWEICNKVGGIYTVIMSKLREAIAAYGDQYVLLGPDLKTNLEFEETEEVFWEKIREGVAIKEIPCRFGRWKIPGEPKVILVGFGKKYNKEQLLFRIWEDYGVDSIAGGWDYVEPVMFSYACGEVIETLYNILARPQGKPAVAQFHEWMCGAGLLCLNGFHHPCHDPGQESGRIRHGYLCRHGAYLSAARGQRPAYRGEIFHGGCRGEGGGLFYHRQ